MMRWHATQLLRNRAAMTLPLASSNSTISKDSFAWPSLVGQAHHNKGFIAEDVTKYLADGFSPRGCGFFASFQHFGGSWSASCERGELKGEHVIMPKQLGRPREQGTLRERNQKTLVLRNIPVEIASVDGYADEGVAKRLAGTWS
jgi:hypothetical protein